MIGYECFVGVLTAKGDIYLLEAGQNCERGHEPMKPLAHERMSPRAHEATGP